MTELEWLKQESGLTEEELKAMEAVAGHTKFVGMLQKMIASSDEARKAKETAEAERIAFEKRYNDEFIPEMRRVTQDSLKAQSDAAAAKAALEAARQYGIVPPEPVVSNEPARAPGSPSPASATVPQDQFRDWASAQSRAILSLNDLNAEHFKLFKEPLSASQELMGEVQRQHMLGHKDFTIQNAWEAKYNVPAKRQEIQAAELQKAKEEYAEAKLKEYKQKNGSNPAMVSGQPSRFSTYKPSEGNNTEPWKTPRSQQKVSNQPWRDKAAQKIAAA
ncbi:MAG: hypothetical protein KGL39_19230 [Patescibacteria group bacterium]|nr:hypothetical protein [Patescibacteria group bacterium]